MTIDAGPSVQIALMATAPGPAAPARLWLQQRRVRSRARHQLSASEGRRSCGF